MIKVEVERNLDTPLSWEQLRIPQASSCIVKPTLRRLMRVGDKGSKGIVYALMANCLQFKKEAEENPGNMAILNSRALLCELLAIKLLREFSFRELVRI